MGLDSTTRKRWEELRPGFLCRTPGRHPDPNPTNYDGPTVVVVDFNTRLHSMFDKTRYVSVSEIAQAFMEEFLWYQSHYTKGGNQLNLVCVVIDHHEALPDEDIFALGPRNAVRFPHPRKDRTLIGKPEYDQYALERTQRVGGDTPEAEERMRRAASGGVVDLVAAQADQEEKDRQRHPQYRETDDKGQPLTQDFPSGHEAPHYCWGRLMESRIVRDRVWQEALQAIEAYDKLVDGAWSHSLKAPLLVRHGPHDVMVLNPSATRPPQSRRRRLHCRLSDCPDGVSWQKLDFERHGWFAEADKELQRLVYDYTRLMPTSNIVIHSIDTDFLLYGMLAFYPRWKSGEFQGKVVMANHLAMADRQGQKLAYTWWCDMSEMLRLVVQTCKISLVEFTTLTVLGGTDFFGGGRLLVEERAQIQERNERKVQGQPMLPEHKKLPYRDTRVRFWNTADHQHYLHYMANRNKDVHHPVNVKQVMWPALNSPAHADLPLRQKVENIVRRAIELQQKALKFNAKHFEIIYQNVRYALCSQAFVRKGEVNPAFYVQ